MTLRAKLALAMTVVALVPMGVALALPMLQAERRARDEASLRLKAVLRQAGILIEREKKDVASRVAQVSSDLARDRPDRQPLWQGAATAGPIALALAERYGLDHLEIRDSRGTLLALSDADPRSDPAVDLSALEEGEVVLRPLPFPSFAADRRAADFVRPGVARGPGTFPLIGGRIVGRALKYATRRPAAKIGRGHLRTSLPVASRLPAPARPPCRLSSPLPYTTPFRSRPVGPRGGRGGAAPSPVSVLRRRPAGGVFREAERGARTRHLHSHRRTNRRPRTEIRHPPVGG